MEHERRGARSLRGATRSLRVRAALAGAAIAAIWLGVGVQGGVTPLPSGSPEQAAAARPSTPAQPNIVVIETDDQTAESVRVMSEVRTLLGGQGATFTNSFVNYPLCCPSRATFLTGQYAHNHGVLANQPPDGGFDVFEASYATNNLAVWLRTAGYRTAMIGKYLNGYGESDPTLVPPGWTEWYAAVPPDQRVYDYDLNENGTLVHHGTAPGDFKQDVLTDKAVDFVNRRAPSRRPFFAWVTYTAPHAGGPNPNPNPPFDCDNTAKPAPRHANAFDTEPLPRPPSFNEADVSDKPPSIQSLSTLGPSAVANVERRYRCRLESLLSVDDGVARLVGALRAAGELDQSLVIFTSDNGFFHGEHRIRQGKFDLYDESIRVPLLLRGLGIPPGQDVPDAAINADLAPTILSAANVAPNLVIDGESLLPFARQPGSEPPRDLLIETNTYAAIRTSPCTTWTSSCIYAEHLAGENAGVQELYDLGRDPYELESVHGSSDPGIQQAKADLAQRLQALRQCAGASCR